MLNIEFKLDETLNVEELSSEEASSTNGGESLWYWVAYGVGAIGRGMEAFRSGAAYSSEHMPGLK